MTNLCINWSCASSWQRQRRRKERPAICEAGSLLKDFSTPRVPDLFPWLLAVGTRKAIRARAPPSPTLHPRGCEAETSEAPRPHAQAELPAVVRTRRLCWDGCQARGAERRDGRERGRGARAPRTCVRPLQGLAVAPGPWRGGGRWGGSGCQGTVLTVQFTTQEECLSALLSATLR